MKVTIIEGRNSKEVLKKVYQYILMVYRKKIQITEEENQK
ncbi:hypothetical protein AB7M70_011845 [Bradyrhizobium japonicum]